MNCNTMKILAGRACAFAAMLFAGTALAETNEVQTTLGTNGAPLETDAAEIEINSYSSFDSNAMSAAESDKGWSVTTGTAPVLTADKNSTFNYFDGRAGGTDSNNCKPGDRAWMVGAKIKWPTSGYWEKAWHEGARLPSRVTGVGKSSSGTYDVGTGSGVRATTKSVSAVSGYVSESAWWSWMTAKEAYDAEINKNGVYQMTLTMGADNIGIYKGVSARTFTINVATAGLELKDDKGVQWYPVVALVGSDADYEVYGDLNVALVAGGRIKSVADATITNKITLAAGTIYYKNGKNVSGLNNLTLLGGSYDFDPTAVGCTLGKGCAATYNEATGLWDVAPCTHDWKYEIIDNGATFKATCQNGCGYTPQSVKVVVTPAEKTYDGTELTASLEYNKGEAEFKDQTGATVGEIVWMGDKKSAGEHTASVTITDREGGTHTISNTVTIAAAGMSTASVTLKTTEVLFTGLEQTNAIASVSSAAGIDENDWEIVDETALYGAGSGYSNVTYTVTLQGKRNYTGTTTATWTVKAPTREFASDAMGRGDFDVSSTLYNDDYGKAVGRELVVSDSTKIIFVNGYWWVGMTVDLPTDINVTSPSSSSLTDDDNLRVTVSTTCKTYTGTQIYNKQVTDTLFQIVDGDHDSQWWWGLGTFQYFKKLRWFTPVSPAMIEQAKIDGKEYLEFTMTVGGITGRWEGLKYTDFTIKAPVDGFVFKVGRNEYNTADIGNVKFDQGTPKIQLIADSVVTNACKVDYVGAKYIYTEAEGYSVFETKVSDTCWVYSCERSIVTVNAPNAEHTKKTVKVGETEIEPIDQDKTQYRVREGDKVVVTYEADPDYVPEETTCVIASAYEGASVVAPYVGLPVTVDTEQIAHATCTSVTTGESVRVESPYVVFSNAMVTVVYEADEGYLFPGNTNEITRTFKADRTVSGIPEAPEAKFAEAKTGDKPYLTVGEAFEAANARDAAYAVTSNTVTLLTNATVTAALQVTNAHIDVTFDLNGKTLTAEGAITAICVNEFENRASFTLKDTSEPSTGKITHAGEGIPVNGGALYANRGTVTFESGTITNCQSYFGGGVFVAKAQFTMKGGKIADCRATGDYGGEVGNNMGGAIYTEGFVTITGGEICGCTAASGKADSIYVNTNDLRITDGKIKGSIANADTNEGTVELTGGYYDGAARAGADALCAKSYGFIADKTHEGYPWTVTGVAARIDAVNYVTLADALKARKPGDTIELLADNAEDVELALDEKFALKPGEFSYTGKVTTQADAVIIATESAGVTTYWAAPLVVVTPAAVGNAQVTVYTNGTVEVSGTPRKVITNETVKIVYKAESGYYFANGTTALTNELTAATNPTVDTAGPGDAYKPHIDGDVTYTVRITDMATLEAFLAKPGNGYLAEDVTLTKTVFNGVYKGPCVTNRLCLAGKVLNMNKKWLICFGDMTIADCKAEDVSSKHFFKVEKNGLWKLTEDEEQATTNLCGGVVTGGYAENQGAFYVNGGNLTIEGGNFVGNCGKWGGALYAYNGSLTVNGGRFIGNCATYGAAIYGYQNTAVSITGGTFAKNVATYGGVIYGYQNTAVSITGGTFAENVATYGGAIYGYGNTAVSITGGMFAENVAESGGAYYAFDKGATVGGAAMFVGNKGSDSGSAISNWGALTLQDNVVISNNVGKWGTIYNSGTLTVTGEVQIVDNAADGGGGIYNDYYKGEYPGICQLLGGRILGNEGPAVVNTDGTFTLGGDAVLDDNVYEGPEDIRYDFETVATTTPIILSDTVPYTTQSPVYVGNYWANGATNNFLTVVTNAVESDLDRFYSADPHYQVWFDAAEKTLKLALPVAKIVSGDETNLYVKLDEAFDAAEEGETVTLVRGCASDGTPLAKALTLDENGFPATNVCLGAAAKLTLAGVTGSPNKLRESRPEFFGTIADKAKVYTDRWYVFHGKLNMFLVEGAVALAELESGEKDGYTTLKAALDAVKTGGTVWLLEDIETGGFAVKRDMTIDLVWCADDAEGFKLVVTNCATKTTGITVYKATENVKFVGGTISASADSGIRTLVESASARLEFVGVNADGTNLDTAKTPYTLTILNGKFMPTNTTITAASGYALNVNCYGTATNVWVAFDEKECSVDGKIMINVQNRDALVKVRLGDLELTDGQVVVNAYGWQTIVTKSATTHDPKMDNPEYTWQSAPGQHQLVFGVVRIIGGKYYSDIWTALGDASDGDTIALCADLETSDEITVDKSVNFDLMGYALRSKESPTRYAMGMEDGVEVAIYGTNTGSAVYGNIGLTNGASTVRLVGGKYVGGVTAFNGSQVELDGADLYCGEAYEAALQLGGVAAGQSSDDASLTIRGSRVSGYSAVYVSGGDLTVSNSTLSAYGWKKAEIDRVDGSCGTADALVIDNVPGKEITVDVQADSRLTCNTVANQLGWYENGSYTASVYKKVGVDLLAVDGFGWVGSTDEGVLEMREANSAIYGISPTKLIITKNTLNLAGAYDLAAGAAGGITPKLCATGAVNVGGEQIPVTPELAEEDDETVPFEMGATADTLTVKTIPGFTYELLSTKTLGGTPEVVDRVRADGARTTLTAPKGDGSARFYQIRLAK